MAQTTASAPDSSYPVSTRHATGRIAGTDTDVTLYSFADKLMITISQDGRLAQWIHLPLASSTPTSRLPELSTTTNTTSPSDDDDNDNNQILPLTHLTPKTLLGGTANSERETLAGLMATQIGSSILAREPGEERVLVLGLGLGLGFGKGRGRGQDGGGGGRGEDEGREEREEEGDERREGVWELVELVERVL